MEGGREGEGGRLENINWFQFMNWFNLQLLPVDHGKAVGDGNWGKKLGGTKDLFHPKRS